MPKIAPHELRHTAASLAVSAGANVKALQRMLGHAKASQTLDRYADLFDDDLDQVADRLDVVAFPGVPEPEDPAKLCPKCVHGRQQKAHKPRLPKKHAA